MLLIVFRSFFISSILRCDLPFGSFDFPQIFSECQSGKCIWMESHEVAEPIEASSFYYGGAPLFSFGFGVGLYSSMLVIFIGQCMPTIFLRCLL